MLDRISYLLGWARGSEKPSRIDPWLLPFEDTATEADIFNCFRIILGRTPHREEWAGHSSRAGEPLTEVVKGYLNSQEFSLRHLLDPVMPEGITFAHNGMFHVYADQTDAMLGAAALAGTYEPEVANVLRDRLSPGDLFLDVGANLGYFSLMAAKIVGPEGCVYSIEPNEHNVKLLESSRRANKFDNINIVQAAASERIETLFLHSSSGNGSTSNITENASLFSNRTIPGLPLDLLLSGRTQPVKLIKIDVEGYEYKALLGAQSILSADRPFIVFEFQASGLNGIGGTQFLEWLQGFGYAYSPITAVLDSTTTQTVEQLMHTFQESQSDHIDVLARPAPH